MRTDTATPHEQGSTGAVCAGSSGVRSRDELETEIRRMWAAASHCSGPSVKWVKAHERVLRWVLGIEPQSPLDRWNDPAPAVLPPTLWQILARAMKGPPPSNPEGT